MEDRKWKIARSGDSLVGLVLPLHFRFSIFHLLMGVGLPPTKNFSCEEPHIIGVIAVTEVSPLVVYARPNYMAMT
jgi:hypothetical protein